MKELTLHGRANRLVAALDLMRHDLHAALDRVRVVSAAVDAMTREVEDLRSEVGAAEDDAYAAAERIETLEARLRELETPSDAEREASLAEVSALTAASQEAYDRLKATPEWKAWEAAGCRNDKGEPGSLLDAVDALDLCAQANRAEAAAMAALRAHHDRWRTPESGAAR